MDVKRKIKVLVVDDDDAIIDYVTCLLCCNKDFEFDAVSASNGQDAWELIQKIHFDLLITDINMPKLNGDELIKKIRDEQLNIEIIAISGSFKEDNISELHVVLSKPMSMSSLFYSIKNLMCNKAA